MIEAINCCNSIHGSRNILQTNGIQNKPLLHNTHAVGNDLKKLVVAGACTGAISMITDTLLNSNQLIKSNLPVIKGIFKDAAIWCAIGGACYASFRLIESALIRKPQQT